MSKQRECWVDGSECPYGSPGGKFAEAPLDACKGCHIAGNYTDELEELIGFNETVKELEEDIFGEIAVNLISIADLLNKLARNEYGDRIQEEVKIIIEEFISLINSKWELECEIDEGE